MNSATRCISEAINLALDITIRKKIKNLITQINGNDYADTCQIWKNHDGWWIKPLDENAKLLGPNWKEIKARLA